VRRYTIRRSGIRMVAANAMSPSILETYCARTPASARAHARAERVMPGGTSRQAGYWPPYPLTLTRGQGACVDDLDGHRYLDLICNYTALVHGHAYPPIVEAAKRQIADGTCWPAGNEAQSALATRLVERVDGIEQVRFTNSGTEAAALAFSIARLITGRQKLLMARFGYHGSLLEFECGSFGREGPLTVLASYNDLADFRNALDRHGDDIAAVFIEPVLGSGGVQPASPGFLHGVQQAARDCGALFVLDEVLTLRFAQGGCQTRYGLTPDLSMFGKMIGGGFPVGAVGGSRSIMSVFDPADLRLFHTGTFNANPVTMTAGEIALAELTPARIAEMANRCEELRCGLHDIAQRQGLPLTTNVFESCLNLYFSDVAPASSVVRTDTALITDFHLAALNHGLLVAPRGMIALSTVITRAHIDEALERSEAAMRDVSEALCGRPKRAAQGGR